MYKTFSRGLRGFTLIELLVVIAIIGILASVVLVSLNSARNKGNDAAVKANLGGVRTQAELYYDDNGSRYEVTDGVDSVCLSTPVTNAVAQAGTAGGGAGVCMDDADSWAASAPLRAGDFWCVDNSGQAATTSAAVSSSAGCP